MNESILTFRCYRKKYNFRKLKKYIIIMIIFISIIIPTKVFADTENEIMNNTQEKFNINSFIKEADKYTGDFLEDVNLGDMLNQAIQGKVDNKTLYQKIFKMFGKEITVSLKTLISILVIIVIHGILKSVTDNLENKNISQIIYFVQYILIVTLIMSNFTEIIKIVKNTADDLVGFINITDVYGKHSNNIIIRTNYIICYKFYCKFNKKYINSNSFNNSSIFNNLKNFRKNAN